MKHVTLIPEKFKPIRHLLERADYLLSDSVDLLVVVGLYREFAQNVQSGSNTILEPVMPNIDEIFSTINMFKRKWIKMYPRLTVVFTIPQVLDFLHYNSLANPSISQSMDFIRDMNAFSHKYSMNIMTFFKDMRPRLTMDTRRIWLYHVTNALFDQHKGFLQILGNMGTEPKFPPKSTFDGFKPTGPTSERLRNDLMTYITKIFAKNPVDQYQ